MHNPAGKHKAVPQKDRGAKTHTTKLLPWGNVRLRRPSADGHLTAASERVGKSTSLGASLSWRERLEIVKLSGVRFGSTASALYKLVFDVDDSASLECMLKLGLGESAGAGVPFDSVFMPPGTADGSHPFRSVHGDADALRRGHAGPAAEAVVELLVRQHVHAIDRVLDALVLANAIRVPLQMAHAHWRELFQFFHGPIASIPRICMLAIARAGCELFMPLFAIDLTAVFMMAGSVVSGLPSSAAC